MMAVVMILVLLVLQFLCGAGVLRHAGIRLPAVLFVAVALLSGLAIASLVPFVLQLCFIPITFFTVFPVLVVVSVLLNLKYGVLLAELRQIAKTQLAIRLSEIPFLLVIFFLVMVSIWRCFYLPPTPRDLTSGPEAIAEYTVAEKTMANSVFTVNLETTNNQFKPPYITSLQVIYKLAGFPFGQVWLSIIFVCLVLVLYQLLSAKVHPAIAGFLVTALIAIPEMYAYSFMALFDFPNAAYFFLAAWFLSRFLSEEHRGDLLMAAWMMGIATYIRSETLILAFLMLPVFFVAGRKLVFKRTSFIGAVIFLTAAVLAYLLSVTVYVNLYLPAGYEISRLLNNNLLNLESLAARFAGMNRELIFSSHGVEYFGYFIFLFLIILLGDALATRHWNLQARHYLYGILVIYLGLPVIGFLLPLMDLEHSTKRGMFKLFPLMVLYMGNCGLLQRLSQRLDTWERNNSR